jgi:GTP cyclohydrolase I
MNPVDIQAFEHDVLDMLERIGEDPHREDLVETPTRVRKAFEFYTSGYKLDPRDVLKSFTESAEKYDEMVIVHNIPIVSMCAHHLAPIIGIAHIGYIPNGRVVGLSKLPRLANIFARRLQLQERISVQIADALDEALRPLGVGVLIRASHGCMSTRGVQIHGSTTTTTALRGVVKNEASARAEFLQLCAMAERDR